jgi:hypothetical protein
LLPNTHDRQAEGIGIVIVVQVPACSDPHLEGFERVPRDAAVIGFHRRAAMIAEPRRGSPTTHDRDKGIHEGRSPACRCVVLKIEGLNLQEQPDIFAALRKLDKLSRDLKDVQSKLLALGLPKDIEKDIEDIELELVAQQLPSGEKVIGGRNSERPVPESVGMAEIVEIVARAIEVFGDRTKALRWMRTPIPSLGGATPEEMLERDGGIEQVEEVLGRIEHGVW